MQPRLLESQIVKDLERKMVFLSGPRQSGKTTLAEALLQKAFGSSWPDRYLNWDSDEHRERILRRELPSESGMLVFDELHKFSDWRRFLKGLYDTRKRELKILVTGSGRLDYYRRGGDSLQGRYHHLRFYPFSLKELDCAFDDLFTLGPFPEPLLSGSAEFVGRWSREHRVRIVRDDLQDVERVVEFGKIELLSLRLPELVGSPLSLNSLREDLNVSHMSIQRWIEILEHLFYIFRIHPFGSPKIKAVKKESKHYHFDWTVIEDEGARFENLIGFHLLKDCHFIEDRLGQTAELRFFRDIEGREVDFVTMADGKPLRFIECKLSERKIHAPLLYLKRKFSYAEAIQVIAKPDVDFTSAEGVRVCSAAKFLRELRI